jgi:hypothetical protein
LGGSRGFERDALTGSDDPAGGSDFDELAVGVGEIEEDLFGSVSEAARIDAIGDADVGVVRIAGGMGFEVVKDGAEGVGGGDGFVLGEELVEEPKAEGVGTDGEGAIAGGLGGDGDEGASAGGVEGGAALGDAEEGVEGGRAAGFGWGMRRETLLVEV